MRNNFEDYDNETMGEEDAYKCLLQYTLLDYEVANVEINDELKESNLLTLEEKLMRKSEKNSEVNSRRFIISEEEINSKVFMSTNELKPNICEDAATKFSKRKLSYRDIKQSDRLVVKRGEDGNLMTGIKEESHSKISNESKELLE